MTAMVATIILCIESSWLRVQSVDPLNMPRTLVQHRMLHATATLDEQVTQVTQRYADDIQREAGKLIKSEQLYRGVGAKKAGGLD